MLETTPPNATPNVAIPKIAVPNDSQLNISSIRRQFRAIAEAKGWQVYHTPKNLAAAVAVEASELLAEFQWLTAEESQTLSAEKKEQVAGEIADVVMYISELCAQLNIDLNEAVEAKMQININRFL
jgi:NTP pyrophosphatase (non-canonical NTP hydrolase)